jgi:hypothetical protein
VRSQNDKLPKIDQDRNGRPQTMPQRRQEEQWELL